jgi:hypothetical protein
MLCCWIAFTGRSATGKFVPARHLIFTLRKYSDMNKWWAIAAWLITLTACENRRTDDISTSKLPDETMDRENTDNTNRDELKTTHLFDDKHEERDDDNLLFDQEKEDRVDKVVANAGRSIFSSECATWHRVAVHDKDGMENMAKKLKGPNLTDVVDKRNDRWLVKIMTNTDGSTGVDKEPENICILQRKGKELNRDQALKVLEYLHLKHVENNAR